MSDNYFRKFIVLDSYDSYTNKIKGYAKIEIRQDKGKLQINIDGLKDFDKDNNLLKAYVVSDDNKFEKIYIGAIDISSNGKGSLEHKFNSLSINSSGIPFNKVNIILVKSFGNDINNINLGGYIYKNSDSIESLFSNIEYEVKSNNVETKQEEVQKEEYVKEEPEKEIGREIQIDDYKEEEIQVEVEEVQDEDIEAQSEVEDNLENIYTEVKEEFEGIEDDIEEDYVEDIDYAEFNINDYEFDELDEIEEFEDIQDIDNEVDEYLNCGNQNRINEVIEEDYKKYKDIQANYNEYINNYYANSVNHNYNRPHYTNLEDYTMRILKMFDKTDNLKRGLKNYEWWYVDKNNKNKEYLPYYPCTVNMYYPHPIMHKEMTCQKLIYKYGHFIFGLVRVNGKIKYYVFGVPGRFKRMEQPYSGQTGFSTWIEKKSIGKYRMGYWLIHIEPSSGKVVNPLKTTQPK